MSKEEQVNHPSHYNQYPVEVIDMMLNIWGYKSTIDFCIMNAFKYRMRIGLKGLSLSLIQQDLDKEAWYLAKVKELSLENPETITFSFKFDTPEDTNVVQWLEEWAKEIKGNE